MSDVFVIVDGKLYKMVDEDHPNRVKAYVETMNDVVKQMAELELRLGKIEGALSFHSEKEEK